MPKDELKYISSFALGLGASLCAFITFLVFFVAKENQFVALDDYAYIVNNAHIETLDWNTVLWSFTSFHEGNWHPLTMLSLALDIYLWGLNPAAFHIVNIVIHSFTVFCSCFLFSRLLHTADFSYSAKSSGSFSLQSLQGRLTGLSKRGIAIGSIAGALFFGLHPLRVESVVWASERKDVLCMFFMTASLWMYVRYAGKQMTDSTVPYWRRKDFLSALALALMAQMSKPTAVSLPLILCIIDWYPLKKISDISSLFRSLVDKIPFLIISAMGVVLTLFAQQIAMKYAPDVGVVSRLLVACKALLFYMTATLWPSRLSAFYMHPGDITASLLPEYVFYALLVLLISVSVIYAGRKNRLWPAVWLYYVVTLSPMLGIIQVGGQWVADRYSYLPSLGISLLWGTGVAYASDRVARGDKKSVYRFYLSLAVCQLLLYTIQTVRQIPVWRTTETLATRIIDKAPHVSGAPYLARAIYRNETGRYAEALEDCGEAMKISLRRGLTATYSEIAYEQAVILKNLGRYLEALTVIEWGIQVSVGPPPNDAINLRDNLGRAVAEGRTRR